MHFQRHFLELIATLGIILSGCGQTGALYLPERGSESTPAPASSDAESAAGEAKERVNRRGTQDAPASGTETPATPPDPDRPTQTPQGQGDR